MRYRLLVFDWDGTIIDSAATIASCIRLAAAELALEVPTMEQARHVIGLGLHDALRAAVPQLAAERTAEFVARYREHFRAREDEMAATGKSRRGLERALEATRLRPYFRASRCADETNPKPDPAMLRELMEELEVPAQNALMIGDTSHDLEMARAARVDALAVTYGAHPEQGLRACGPRGCVASVAELGQWLATHG
ncbi:MAG: HAD family hydrolase [Betaproteobacteria bacterium]|nr:MAG: HAD family hydrolase [Betaproteobacteria bacterium]